MAGEYRVVGPVAVVRVAGRRVSVECGGVVPEGADAEHLAHLVSVGLVSKVEVADEVAPAEAKGIDGMTVAELKEHAAARGIDLGEAGKKDEILAAIRASEA